ncbi:glycosyltransferase [Paenibacillus thermoaerophilus]|uniref:Glycosyltransferase n=1 Tax=Paenibacillus thermoaerophilus TaxID=1215385 RepID=A0ABW2V4M7_9BACL|nr:glycosyltransferase [Paenibacillus thermoaerophilus]TMV07348.1 glycosyltransferase [Paenibacillus thermoaerophilus]
MITVSLCMIVRNEEEVLARCLDSVADLVDEIVIVDTGSTDKTKEIAARYTDRIFDFEWIDDFAAARNYSFSLATQSYIMWLDADDLLFEKDREKFRQLKQTLDPRYDSVVMEYHLAFDDAGNPTAGSRRNRLVKRSKGYRWVSPIHEYLDVSDGNLYLTDIAVSHKRVGDHSARNMRIFKEKIVAEGKLEGRNLFYYANELADAGQYEEASELYQRYLSGPVDYPEDHMMACSKLAECYHNLGQPVRKLESLLMAFKYDKPRADFCCWIGYCFEAEGHYATAIYWYETALKLEKPLFHMGVQNLVCWTWMPHVQLCICYAKLGELQKAYEHNEQALSYLPEDANLLSNKRKLEAALAGKAQAGGAAGGEEPPC